MGSEIANTYLFSLYSGIIAEWVTFPLDVIEYPSISYCRRKHLFCLEAQGSVHHDREVPLEGVLGKFKLQLHKEAESSEPWLASPFDLLKTPARGCWYPLMS